MGIVYSKRIESLVKYSVTQVSGDPSTLNHKTAVTFSEYYGKRVNDVVVGCAETADVMRD